MSRNYQLYSDDILDACLTILDYTKGMSFDQFCADKRTYQAVLYNLAKIGEAIKHLPSTFIKDYPDIEKRKIADLRNIIIHGYFVVDQTIIWDIVQNKVPQLRDQLN